MSTGPSTSLTVGASGSGTRHRSKTSAGRRWVARRNSLGINSSGFHGFESVRMRTDCCLSNNGEVKCREVYDYHANTVHRIFFVILSIINGSFGSSYRRCRRDCRIAQLHRNIIPRFGTDPVPQDAICAIDPALYEADSRRSRRCNRRSCAFGCRCTRSRAKMPIPSILVRPEEWSCDRFPTNSLRQRRRSDR